MNKELIKRIIDYDIKTEGKVKVRDLAKILNTNPETICKALIGNGRGRSKGFERNEATITEPIAEAKEKIICPICRKEISDNHTQIAVHFDCANKVFKEIQ